MIRKYYIKAKHGIAVQSYSIQNWFSSVCDRYIERVENDGGSIQGAFCRVVHFLINNRIWARSHRLLQAGAGMQLDGNEIDKWYNSGGEKEIALQSTGDIVFTSNKPVLELINGVNYVSIEQGSKINIIGLIGEVGTIAGWVDIERTSGDDFIFENIGDNATERSRFFLGDDNYINIAIHGDQGGKIRLANPFDWSENERKRIGYIVTWDSDYLVLYIADENGEGYSFYLHHEVNSINSDIAIGAWSETNNNSLKVESWYNSAFRIEDTEQARQLIAALSNDYVIADFDIIRILRLTGDGDLLEGAGKILTVNDYEH